MAGCLEFHLLSMLPHPCWSIATASCALFKFNNKFDRHRFDSTVVVFHIYVEAVYVTGIKCAKYVMMPLHL